MSEAHNESKSEVKSINGPSSKESSDGDDEEEEDVLIEEGEMERLREFFESVDRKKLGYVKVEEAMHLFKRIKNDYNFSEEEMFELLDKSSVEKTRMMTFENIIQVVEHIRKIQNKENDLDTIDAYVAVGGDEDKGGCVDAGTLIKIIKEDFEMTIDIEKLIQDIDEDGSGEIEWGEFRSLMK